MGLWNLDMDWNSDEEAKVEPFNLDFAIELFNKPGNTMSWIECCLVAGTEMEGVAEDEYGNVHGRQTNCNVLNYSEEL